MTQGSNAVPASQLSGPGPHNQPTTSPAASIPEMKNPPNAHVDLSADPVLSVTDLNVSFPSEAGTVEAPGCDV